MVYLQNEQIKLSINEIGAELISVKTADGKEHIWIGDPDVWKGHAPMLFPICGRLKDNMYIYKGKEYNLFSHGFAKDMQFTVVERTDSKASFELQSNEETLAQFPFAFVLRVDYRLSGKDIAVSYTVTNVGEDKMYFSIGSHEGYMCEGGISGYHLKFDEKVTLDSYEVEGPIINRTTTRILEDSDVLPLKDEYFAVDALVFKNIEFDAVSLVKNDDTRQVRVEFPGCQGLLLWMKPNAPYLCIEPWFGIPDTTDTDHILEKKEYIQKLAAGKTFRSTHTIRF